MAVQRVVMQLTELRCIEQSEGSGGSEPYLWVSYFAFGAPQLPFQTGLFGILTPSFNGFRTDFPNGIKAGQAAPIPPFIATGLFDLDLESAPQPKLFGCIAVLMEQDETPESSIALGQIAYAKEIQVQLNALAKERFLAGDLGPVREAEIDAIKSAVESRVRAAVASNQQNIFALFRNQDDSIGVTFVMFTHDQRPGGVREITPRFFDFPEIRNGSDRFQLSGRLMVQAVPGNSVDRCAVQRAALSAKEDEVASLQSQRSTLQSLLQSAPPGAKADLIDAIQEAGERLAEAESQLPALRAALEACLDPLPDQPVADDAGNAPVILE